MQIVILLACLASAAATANEQTQNGSLLEKLFNDFRQLHNKIYRDKVELERRFDIFKENLKRIVHLKLSEKGSAKYAVNKFADLTEAEFAEQYLGHKDVENQRTLLQNLPPLTSAIEGDLPVDGIDWRQYGAVRSVKDQAHCGSCWAFSVAANIEGLWQIKTGQSVDLSPQQLVDCDRQSHGCQGGYTVLAYKTVERLGGLKTFKDYPYVAQQHQGCLLGARNSQPAAYINDSVTLPEDENQIAQYLYANGPVSVLVNARPWQFYSGGVSRLASVVCNPMGLNHAVLAVGFGYDQAEHQPYWIIKNSWGIQWGEEGYMRLYRGANTCGVARCATSALIY